jgi:hypothetical protein
VQWLFWKFLQLLFQTTALYQDQILIGHMKHKRKTGAGEKQEAIKATLEVTGVGL